MVNAIKQQYGVVAHSDTSHITCRFPEASFDLVHDTLKANNGNQDLTVRALRTLELTHTPAHEAAPVAQPTNNQRDAMRAKAMVCRVCMDAPCNPCISCHRS